MAPGRTALLKLHVTIQQDMGRFGARLYALIIDVKHYGEPAPDCAPPDPKSEKRGHLHKALDLRRPFDYIGDYGDNSAHWTR